MYFDVSKQKMAPKVFIPENGIRAIVVSPLNAKKVIMKF